MDQLSKKSVLIWNKLKKPILALAPMAGITDQPFRIIAKKFGADVVFSEMVSTDAIWHQKITNTKSQITNKSQMTKSEIQNSLKNEKLKFENYLPAGKAGLEFEACSLGFTFLKTLNLIKFSKMERPFIVQIFGSDPEKMAYSAEYIGSGEWAKDYFKITKSKIQISNPSKILRAGKYQNLKSEITNSLDIGKFGFGNCLEIRNLDLEIASIPDGIDINMGCPAKDVIKQGAGAALMKDSKKAGEIVKAIKNKTKLPISVKTRLGWENPTDILKFCRTLEYAGIDALIIHARTYKQGFSGIPDWKMVYKVKKQLKIPVILNGGIETLEDYQRVDLDQVDGIMIGRGALGRPWIFDEIKNPNLKLKSHRDPFGIKNLKLLKKTILQHAHLTYQLKDKQGIIELRKHLGWYFKGIPNSKKIRDRLVRISSLKDLENILAQTHKLYKKIPNKPL